LQYVLAFSGVCVLSCRMMVICVFCLCCLVSNTYGCWVVTTQQPYVLDNHWLLYVYHILHILHNTDVTTYFINTWSMLETSKTPWRWRFKKRRNTYRGKLRINYWHYMFMCICWYEIKHLLKLKCTVNTILNGNWRIRIWFWEIIQLVLTAQWQ
jgi:hypothetical protein